MNRYMLSAAVVVTLLLLMGTATAVHVFDEGTYTAEYGTTYDWRGGHTVHVDAYAHSTANLRDEQGLPCYQSSRISVYQPGVGYVDVVTSSLVRDETCDTNPNPGSISWSGDIGNEWTVSPGRGGGANLCGQCAGDSATVSITFSSEDRYTVSGATACLTDVTLYIYDGSDYQYCNYTALGSSYLFPIFENHDYMLVFSNGAYYDFTCDGNEVFDYDVCIYVYGYTCGITDIKLYTDDGGWVLDDSTSQAPGYDVYEMLIVSGEDYKISFIDSGLGGTTVCYNQTFACTGSHVLIDYDRCNWVYPPNGGDIPIYIWTGYDYNIVLLKDNHGNLVENGKLAIYDETDDVYIQRWTDNAEGYALLGAMFPTDHDVRMMFRTFDGIFTLDTTYPANGTSLVGEEDITTTEWTIPIKYNLNILPVDQYAVPLFDVFCGLSEYTPLNPQAFWGMDLSDRGFVPVTNCSGFAMCDIIAEKEGYADYKEEALNWTSKSAMVKDYRHNVVMEEE